MAQIFHGQFTSNAGRPEVGSFQDVEPRGVLYLRITDLDGNPLTHPVLLVMESTRTELNGSATVPPGVRVGLGL